MPDLVVGLFIGFAVGIAFSLVVWLFASKEDKKLNQLEIERNFAIIPPMYHRDDEEITGVFTRPNLRVSLNVQTDEQ